MRRIGSWLSICLCLFFASQSAFAQAQGPSKGGWWTPLTTGAKTFRSPQAACRAQFDDAAWEGTKYRGAHATDNPHIYACSWTNFHDGTGPLTVLPTSAIFQCEGRPGEVQAIGSPPHCSTSTAPTCDVDCMKKGGTNPILLATGAKMEHVVDYASADGLFTIERHYNTKPWGRLQTATVEGTLSPFKSNWRDGSDIQFWINGFYGSSLTASNIIMPNGDSYNANTQTSSGPLVLTASGPSMNGRGRDHRVSFIGARPANIGEIKTRSVDWEFTDRDGVIYLMRSIKAVKDASDYRVAKPIRISYPGGYEQYLAYGDHSQIIRKSDNLGRSAQYNWIWFQLGFEEPDGTIDPEITNDGPVPPVPVAVARIDISDGSQISYAYDLADQNGKPETPYSDRNYVDRLKSVSRTSPQGDMVFSQTYLYQNDDYPYHMTGLIDTAGITYGNWSYDEFGRAISSSHPDGVDAAHVTYVDTTSYSGVDVRTVTNALGRNTDYSYKRYLGGGSYALDTVAGAASANVPADVMSIDYLGNGLFLNCPPIEKVDREGRTTTYVHDGYGRSTQITRAAGTPDEYTEYRTWHEDYLGSPTQIIRPGLTVDYTYNNSGGLQTLTQTDTSGNSAGEPRRWAFSYVGPHITAIDGPLAGSSDTQTFTYEGANLTSMTNELGHTTLITAHNYLGAPQSFTDPNGVQTRLVYDSKGRLEQIIQSAGQENARTEITYTATDLVTSVTPPNGARLSFNYDAARRLTDIFNAEGDRIEYTRNAMGEISRTNVQQGSGNIEFTVSQTMDEINRVIKAVGAGGVNGLPAETSFTYDKENNLTNITDPRGGQWQQSFDNLDRLTKDVDPLGAETDYTLDKQSDSRNPLVGLKDARNVTTNYVRNGFGEVVREVSLEAGTTQYVRDTRGLVTQMTDGRGIVSNFTYDAAGRPLSMTFPAHPEDNLTYAYDAGVYGIGHLTSEIKSFGETSYSYDSLGHMTSMTRTLNEQSYTTGYTYDLGGEVLSITHPSGQRVEYTRDAAARIISIESVALDGARTIIAENITYAPFGPLKALDMGDGHQLRIAYDQAYRALNLRRTNTSGAIMDIAFGYDAAGDILSMTDAVHPDRSQSFAYDAVSRLTSADGDYGEIDYAYNLGGDRLRRTWSADGETTVEDYEYDPATARLTGVSLTDAANSGSVKRLFTYAASGQVITDARAVNDNGPEYTYGLNARGRIGTVEKDGAQVAAYTYDGDEQRIVKTANGTTIHYHYDLEGRLISETDGASGAVIRDYIWLGLTPLAVISVDDTDEPCDNSEEIAALEAQINAALNQITAKQNEISNLQSRIVRLERQVTRLENRLAAVDSARERVDARIAQTEAAIAATNNRWRRWRLRVRLRAYTAQRRGLVRQERNVQRQITRVETRAAPLRAQMEALRAEITSLEADAAEYQSQIDALEEACEGGTGIGTQTAGLTFLHADHLGRPVIATSADGAIVWDGGITTPFGEAVSTAGAFTQNLMFPGQYADEETGLSHNWHRTYDPALGRYLQADPIGLAGGLNRYAYVGGNPTGRIDPDGQFWWAVGFAVADLAWQLYKHDGKIECIDPWSIAINALGGRFLKLAFKRSPGTEWSHAIPDRYIRKLSKSGKNPNPHYKPQLDNKLGRWFVNSRFNGNYVTGKFHSHTDPYRFLKGMTKADNWPPRIQQLLRTPGWIPGLSLVGVAGATDFSSNECKCK